MTRQVSMIPEDQTRIVAIYGPLGKDLANAFTVRGVEVMRFDITKLEGNRHYRLCRFPDGRDMWVNEGNLVPRHRPGRFGGLDAASSK
jgi:hypothetical protein